VIRTCGATARKPIGTGRALRCAAEILAGTKDIGLDLRAGVHTGEVEVSGDASPAWQ
jgi:hypothetical protein